jgi:hypothetical protein
MPPAVQDPCAHGLGPGSLVRTVLNRLGFHRTKNCGCKRMCRQMNEWGWLRCATTHRAEIVAWFCDKAKEVGVTVTSESVWGLIRAAIREARRR